MESASFPRGRVRPITTHPGPRAIACRLARRTIAAVGRLGKRIAVELTPLGRAGREWLVIEPRMTGLMLVVEPP
ncbi:MAG: DNA-formamidopyrimidine glycosylase family protein, partial [Pirellula sp.]